MRGLALGWKAKPFVLAAGILLYCAAVEGQTTPLVITTTSLPDATAGVPYSFAFSAIGGAVPYNWSSVGTLPAGLSLSRAGVLSGTPRAPGAFRLTVVASDASGSGLASKVFPLTVLAQPVAITNSSPLPGSTLGTAYSYTFTASGGVAPYRWSAATGLPEGLRLDSGTGVLSGTPQTWGNFSLPVQVTDSLGTTGVKTFVLTIQRPVMSILTASPLPEVTVGAPYSQTLLPSGGAAPYTWSLISGQLPGGLTLDANAGSIAGIPAGAGTFSFTIGVRENGGATASKLFTLNVRTPVLTITTAAPLPGGGTGVNYSQSFAVTGGVAPYSWSLTGDGVPGLLLSPAGVLSGTPSSAGTFHLTVNVRDSGGAAAAKVFPLTITARPLAFATGGQLPDATVGAAYSAPAAATGGTPPYTWSVNGLPEGLNMNPATGVITGTPVVPGPALFTVRVTDTLNASVVDVFRISIGLPPAPGIRIEGLPDTANPADQLTLTLNAASPYPLPITGQLSLNFAPAAGAGDDTIQFSTGGRTVDFSINAGSTAAVFSSPQVALQTGTVAGTITAAVRLASAGVEITPSPPPTHAIRIERSQPTLTSARLTRTATGFSIEITGYSTAREVTQAVFRFGAAPGQRLEQPEITMDVRNLFTAWFEDAASAPFGSQFTFTQAFTVSGDAAVVTPQTVILRNSLGESSITVQ